MIIELGQRRSDSFLTEVSKIAVRWSVDRLRVLLIPAYCILSLIGLAAIFVACDQAGPGKSLGGSWFTSNGVVKFSEDGTLESYMTNRAKACAFEGTWLTRGNMLIITTLKSNGVPFHDVSNCKILRADKSHLIYSSEGQTITFVRKGVESKPPQSSAALEKAKRIEISSVYYDGLPLAVVITTLHDECVRRDPARKGVSFSLGPDAKELADAEIHLELRDVTLAETLERVADSVGLEMQATDTELLLVRKKAKQ